MLQPILSGDPALPRVLAENLANQPSARFIWLVDADDPEGLRITAELADGNPRVEVLHCPPCPPLTNPKVFKLALGEPHCTDLVAVLDDDTVLPPGALDRARAALSEADLATGLPWYDSGVGPWNALVAGFVNGNALVTYFPLLGNHGPAVRVRTLREAAIALPRAPSAQGSAATLRRHGGRERPAGRRRTDAGPGHVRSCELVGASTSRSVAATMASK